MPGRADTSLKNRHHLVIGTSGSGKTSWVRQQIGRAARVIAWDPDEDYSLPRVRSLARLAHTLAMAGSKGVKVAVTVNPTPERFEAFARIVWAYACASRPCIVIAEEIADVTPPGKAGVYWGMVVRRGRKYGVQLFAVTQRPAECDKTIYSQAAYKWVGVLDNEMDRKRLAPLLSVSVDQIAALHPLEFYYKQPGPEAAKKGKLTIAKV